MATLPFWSKSVHDSLIEQIQDNTNTRIKTLSFVLKTPTSFPNPNFESQPGVAWSKSGVELYNEGMPCSSKALSIPSFSTSCFRQSEDNTMRASVFWTMNLPCYENGTVFFGTVVIGKIWGKVFFMISFIPRTKYVFLSFKRVKFPNPPRPKKTRPALYMMRFHDAICSTLNPSWKELQQTPPTRMSRWNLGSMVRINGLFHLFIN